MSTTKKNLAIVPARGGSKRLPKKNLKKIGGKSLVQYTLEAVKDSGLFDDVILSSDDDDILKIAHEVNGIVAEKRQSTYAGDTDKVIDLIKAIANRPGYKEAYEKIGLFLPTCPFRSSTHIKEGYDLLTSNDYSVVSVTEMADPVQLSLSLDSNKVVDTEAVLKPSPLLTGNTRSQDFDKLYRVNGGFYIAWLEQFLERDNFFQGKVKGYVMDKVHSVDIDDSIDFEIANMFFDLGYINF